MSPRPASSYVLRALLMNGLIVFGFVRAQRSGQMTGGILAAYILIAVVVNTLMYFGARARRRLQDR